jgi:hypothetical protein
MSNYTDLTIAIDYLLIGSDAWQTRTLEVGNYFDLEPDELADLDSCPYYNHAIDYLDLSLEQVQSTHLTLVNLKTHDQRVIVEKFWNQGKNRIIERTDLGQTPYSETILEIQISETPPVWEVLRLSRDNGSLTPLYHAFLQDNTDGSQTETIVADVARPLTLQH